VGMWERIKSRLGLVDEWDEEFQELEEEGYADDNTESEDDFYGHNVFESPRTGSSSVRRAAREPDLERARGATRTRGGEHLRGVPSGAEVSQMQPQVKMHIVEPKSYSEAQAIADKFKQGTPVIMNMSMTSPDLAKRLLDFASGLTYGLDGGLQKVSDKVFMLTPANVDVSAGDFRRFADKGMFPLE